MKTTMMHEYDDENYDDDEYDDGDEKRRRLTYEYGIRITDYGLRLTYEDENDNNNYYFKYANLRLRLLNHQ